MRKIEESKKLRVKIGMLLYDDVRTCLTDGTFKKRPGGVHVCSVTQSCPTVCDPMDGSPQAPLSMEFSRQGYWSGLLFLTPGDLPNPGIKTKSLMSPALAGGFFTTVLSGKPIMST